MMKDRYPIRINPPIKALVISALILLLIAPVNGWSDGNIFLGMPGVKGGVATTSESLAAQIGGKILRQGGNAVDAASAIAFALNVLEPQSSGIGGFMMIHLKKKRKTFVIDSRERAPEAADPNMFLDTNGDSFAFPIRSTSGVGVGVPGMVRGIALALDNWGTMPLAEVLDPAIKLAQDGFRVSSRLADSIADGIDEGGRLSNEIGDPAYDLARSVFVPGGTPLAQNDLLIQTDLGKTLQMIADKGPDAFYTNPIAQAIVDTQFNARTTDSNGDPYPYPQKIWTTCAAE